MGVSAMKTKATHAYAGRRLGAVILPRGVNVDKLRARAIELDKRGRDTELISTMLGVSPEVVRVLVSEVA